MNAGERRFSVCASAVPKYNIFRSHSGYNRTTNLHDRKVTLTHQLMFPKDERRPPIIGLGIQDHVGVQ